MDIEYLTTVSSILYPTGDKWCSPQYRSGEKHWPPTAPPNTLLSALTGAYPLYGAPMPREELKVDTEKYGPNGSNIIPWITKGLKYIRKYKLIDRTDMNLGV